MNSLASISACVEPPARHGTCRLRLEIGGTRYSLRPAPAPPRARAWTIKALDGPRAGTPYAVASVRRSVSCTCPDHRVNGAICKHVMSLRALGLIPRSATTESEREAALLARARRHHGPLLPQAEEGGAL